MPSASSCLSLPCPRPSLLLGCLLIWLGQSLLPVAEAQAQQFAVVSYNIRYANPGDAQQGDGWDARKAVVFELLRNTDADLMGLQEVLPQQLADLRQAFPAYRIYAVPRTPGNPMGEGPGEATPLLVRASRFTLQDSGTFWLAPTPSKVASKGWDAALPRIASWLRLLDRDSGRELLMLNTHLDHRGERARVESARLIRQKLHTLGADSLPVVLTGDLNTTPSSEPLLAFTQEELVSASGARVPAYRDCAKLSAGPSPDLGTSCGFAPRPAATINKRIDYILVNGAMREVAHEIVTTTRANGRFPSDHLPVVVSFQLR